MKNFTKAQIRALKERTDFDNMTLEELKAVMTKKQQLFCEEYLIDLNGTQAAKRAGYSAKTSCAIGVENLAETSDFRIYKKAAGIQRKRPFSLSRRGSAVLNRHDEKRKKRKHCCNRTRRRKLLQV